MTHYSVLLSILVGVCFVVAMSLAILYFAPVLLRPGRNGGTRYIAEIWLVCDGGRGSTMYRQRFDTKFMAEMYAKLYAIVLDVHLPTHYTVYNGGGRKVREAHNYGIRFHVRHTTVGESGSYLDPIWTTVLPGEADFAGEPAYLHPVSKKEAAQQESYPLSVA